MDAFCVGSELRGLTFARGADGTYPAVERLRRLLGEVRQILGAGCKLSYAADWSEYSAHRPGGGDLRFHLDPLWADPNCDFVGIDNYLPLSDWRDEEDHLDRAVAAAPHDLDYLRSGVEGGEWFDWYYSSEADAAAQVRTPIEDGDHDEAWVWRAKDIRSWWGNAHHDRVGGVRSDLPTAWVPGSKPIRFTEYGCGAIHLGTNQPNLFVDPKSSESALPRGSSGRRDEYAQMQYVRAVTSYWNDPANNPVSAAYGGRMIDMARGHLWAWDARPWPAFPGRVDLWSDGPNYARGHWLNGRTSGRSLASIIEEICAEVGVPCDATDVHGYVRGYVLSSVGSARAALQPLLMAHGVDAVEREGRLVFIQRDAKADVLLDRGEVAIGEIDGDVETIRCSDAELAERIRVTYVEGEGSYEVKVADARMPGSSDEAVSQIDLDVALTAGEARYIAERALAETRVAREVLRLALPPSRADVGAGDVISLRGASARWRVDRVEEAGARTLTATRIDPTAYRAATVAETVHALPTRRAASRVEGVFLDLPLLLGDEVPHAPYAAFAARPWPGSVSLRSSLYPFGSGLPQQFLKPALIGRTETELKRASAGIWDRGAPLRIHAGRGGISSADLDMLLDGANAMAIGSPEGPFEIFQFAHAQPISVDRWDLSLRLRGQAGTDAVMPDTWPVGSTVVLLDGAPEQVRLSPTQRGRTLYLRYGPGDRPVFSDVHQDAVRSFAGEGLRPLAPVHLRAVDQDDGLSISWVRRTRTDGDAWREDVPLGEARERYRVRVLRNGSVLRSEDVSEPGWEYATDARRIDGDGVRVEVAQLSDVFGEGRWAWIDL